MAGESTQDRGPWGGAEVGCGPSAWTWEGPAKESQLLGLASLGQFGPCPLRVCCCDSMLAQGGFLLSGALSPAGMALCHADVIIADMATHITWLC